MLSKILTEREAKMLFSVQGLYKALVTPSKPKDGGFYLCFRAKESQDLHTLSNTRQPSQPRVFKTEKAALEAAWRIGFEEAAVSKEPQCSFD